MLRTLPQKLFTKAHTAVLQRTNGRLLGKAGRTQFLVLHTTGRKSGKDRATPLNYADDGEGGFVLIASNGGASRHPDWYLNLQADGDVEVEVGGERRAMRAVTAEGEERARLWALAKRTYGPYDWYQRRTDREIPVVPLRPSAGS